jgi:hypothetical protein
VFSGGLALRGVLHGSPRPNFFVFFQLAVGSWQWLCLLTMKILYLCSTAQSVDLKFYQHFRDVFRSCE